MLRRSVLLSGVLFSIMSACYLQAQSVTGTITGTIYDPSGSVVPGATIEIRNEGTNLSINSTTSKDGDYRITNLQPGSYEIKIIAAGFKAASIHHAVLQVNAVAREDAHLALGSNVETVSIDGGAQVISTEQSSIGTVIDSHEISHLMVNGRTVDQLVATAAGNTTDGAQNSTPSISGSLRWGGLYYTVDGGTFNDLGNGTFAYSYATNLTTMPSTDSIQELKVQTNMAPAEYEGGAAVTIVTKSGTSQFHGSLTEANRNRMFAAYDRFASTTARKPTFNRNDFGGTIGGPILKDKTFFFFSYDGFMQRKAAYDTSTVPTTLMRSGDFSELLSLSSPIQLVYPGTTTSISGNKITSIDSRAAALLSYYPKPTKNTTLTNNFTDSVATKYDISRYNVKFDDVHLHNHALSLGGTYSNGNPYFVALGKPANYGNYSNAGYITQSAYIRDVMTLSSSLVNELRFGYFSHRSIRVGQNTNYNPLTLFPSLYYQPNMVGGLPTLSFADTHYSYQSFGDYGGSGHSPETTLQLTDSVTKELGHHTLKAGATINFNEVITKAGTNSSVLGTFSFSGTYSGNAFADFLLGDVYSSVRAAASVPVDFRYQQYAFFAQDDWKLTPRLVINYGVRYSLQTVVDEQHGDMSNFDYNSGTLVVRSKGGKMGSGVNQTILGKYPYTTSEAIGWGDKVYNNDLADLGPRLGWSYRLTNDGKMVLRGGYGIFYNYVPVYIGINQLANTNYPFTLSQSYSATASTTPSLTLANPFSTTASIAANPTIYSVDRNLRDARVQQWNLTLEAQLPSAVGMRISWIGNKTTQAPWYLYQMNNPKVQQYGTVQNNRPYQPWGAIYGLVTKGAAETNELQVEVTKRYNRGLFVNASYTWDKSLNNVPTSGSPQNPYNPSGDRGLADGVFQHTVYINATWDLPVHAKGSLGQVVNGWSIAGIAQLRGGMPFTPTFTAVTSSAYTGWLATRPDVVGGVNPYAGGHTLNHWFNTAAFARPTPFTYGNARRNSLIGPKQNVVHLSLQKQWTLRDNIKFQLRADAFNAPNHPSLYVPSGNISSSSVGIVSGTNQDNREVQIGSKLTF